MPNYLHNFSHSKLESYLLKVELEGRSLTTSLFIELFTENQVCYNAFIVKPLSSLNLDLLESSAEPELKCLFIYGQRIQKWAKSNFLKTVFHKFYVVHSWILCPIYIYSLIKNIRSNWIHVYLPAEMQFLILNNFLRKWKINCHKS